MNLRASIVALLLLAVAAPAAAGTVFGEIGGGYDDNVGNASDDDDRFEGPFTFAGATLSEALRASGHWRLEGRVGAAGEWWPRQRGLSNGGATFALRLLDRRGDEFFAPTVATTLSLNLRDYASDDRDGGELRASFAILQPLTTQLSARVSAGVAYRSARARAFDTRSANLGLRLDWQVVGPLSVFAGYQRCFGDIVATVPADASYARWARALSVDDALSKNGVSFNDYRIEARSTVTSAGANLGLSTHFALEADLTYADSSSRGGHRYERWISSLSLLTRF